MIQSDVPSCRSQLLGYSRHPRFRVRASMTRKVHSSCLIAPLSIKNSLRSIHGVGRGVRPVCLHWYRVPVWWLETPPSRRSSRPRLVQLCPPVTLRYGFSCASRPFEYGINRVSGGKCTYILLRRFMQSVLVRLSQLRYIPKILQSCNPSLLLDQEKENFQMKLLTSETT
jgi:hypothetical protein